MIERHKRKIKFSMVSLIATAIDFATLLILTSNGVSTVVANYPSTTAGFIFSFFANKKFTFRTPDHHIHREAILFIAITLFSNWAIQPFLIWVVERLLESTELQDWQSVIAAKLVASTVTFVWNYYFCTRLVFKKKTDV
jgi:putative flippase GtrA